MWVLEQNPALRFYEKTGAEHLMRKQIEIGGVFLSELALGWPDLVALNLSSNLSLAWLRASSLTPVLWALKLPLGYSKPVLHRPVETA